ncbi:hypothetical protein ESZ53_11215 [Salinibacterium sp. UTAS2018]|uniref:hypothetical protein n=1 Tax=Salinibacterium sp. UTAS2018 TaxID=2508880 RepID=UPI0010094229|nr:hypothetical protein [Salinibacterium sp. UTAS2018]QAV70961.1 hypothetical protein ESZ53_11215 [Salinibacterium sp. UTAS2018]
MSTSEETASLSLASIRAPQFVATMLWVIALTTVVFLSLLVRAGIVGHLAGAAEPFSLALAFAANGLFVTVGFVVAEVARQWWSIPLAVLVPLALYAVALFSDGASWFLALNPLGGYVAATAHVPDSYVFAGKCLISLASGLVLVAIAMSRDRTRNTVAVGVVLILAVAPIITGGALIASRNGQEWRAQGGTELEWTTSEKNGLEVKVLSTYLPVLDPLLSTWSRISDLTSTSDLAFTSLTQDLAPTYDPQAPRGTFFRLDLNPRAADIVSSSVESAFNDVSKCAPDDSSGDFWLQGHLIVQSWFMNKNTFRSNASIDSDQRVGDGLSALFALSPDKARAWVKEHQQNIRTCSWDYSDFEF